MNELRKRQQEAKKLGKRRMLHESAVIVDGTVRIYKGTYDKWANDFKRKNKLIEGKRAFKYGGEVKLHSDGTLVSKK